MSLVPQDAQEEDGTAFRAASGSRHALAPTPRLPQELVDHVVASVVPENVDTLLSCCLISHGTLPAATKALFRHLRITKDYRQRLLDQLRTSPRKSLAVRRLQFRWPSSTLNQVLTSKDLCAVLSCTLNIQQLYISGPQFLWERTDDGLPPAQSFRITVAHNMLLTTLVLSDVIFSDAVSALQLICAFPNLGTLSLTSVHWFNNAPTEIQLLPATPRIRNLLALHANSHLAQLLFPHDASHTLESVALDGYHRPGVPNWWQLFGDRHEKVHANLKMINCFYPTSNRRDLPVPFPNAPNVKSLSLDNLHITDRHVRSSVHGRNIKHALDQLAGRTLEVLSVSFVEVQIKDLSLLAVGTWLPSLQEPKFANLRSVVYEFSGRAPLGEHEAEIDECVRRAHKSWDRQEIVSVVVVETP